MKVLGSHMILKVPVQENFMIVYTFTFFLTQVPYFNGIPYSEFIEGTAPLILFLFRGRHLPILRLKPPNP